MSHPDMLEILARVRAAQNRPDDYDAAQIMRDCFTVDSRAQIAPYSLRRWLQMQRLPQQSGVWTLISQAERGR